MFEGCKSKCDFLIGFLYAHRSQGATQIKVTTDAHHLAFEAVAGQLREDHEAGLQPFRFDRSIVGHRYWGLDPAIEALQDMSDLSYPVDGKILHYTLSTDAAASKLNHAFTLEEVEYLLGLTRLWVAPAPHNSAVAAAL